MCDRISSFFPSLLNKTRRIFSFEKKHAQHVGFFVKAWWVAGGLAGWWWHETKSPRTDHNIAHRPLIKEKPTSVNACRPHEQSDPTVSNIHQIRLTAPPPPGRYASFLFLPLCPRTLIRLRLRLRLHLRLVVLLSSVRIKPANEIPRRAASRRRRPSPDGRSRALALTPSSGSPN